MKKIKSLTLFLSLCFSLFISLEKLCIGDDTCISVLNSSNLPPNIVILLDNGISMRHITWHSKYDNTINYTPVGGSVFSNDEGYGIIKAGTDYYLVPVQNDLSLASSGHILSVRATSGNTWVINGKSVSLPAIPSKSAVDGIIDNSSNFIYSKNYLDWIFYSGNYDGDGTDLPNKTRFYFAKKAIMTAAKMTANNAKFGIYSFTSNAEGASNVQPLSLVVQTPLTPQPEDNILDSNFVNNLNNLTTVTYSPLAEGLACIGGYYNSSSSHVLDLDCQKSFVIVVTPGVSSQDQNGSSNSYFPPNTAFEDYDGDNGIDGIGEGNVTSDSSVWAVPLQVNGSTYLDDVAYYLYTQDVVGYRNGFQNVITYTIGFMGDQASNLFLVNTSNNGNGHLNLYDTTDPEYGKYHFSASSPEDMSSVLIAAVKDIIARTNIFIAPVVPVARTTSGDEIYLAFFKPSGGNFWEGSLKKFGLSDDTEILDSSGNLATWPNGAMKENSTPYWDTKDWANSNKANYIHNSSRNIFTYLGEAKNLTDSRNAFKSSNVGLTDTVLGNPNYMVEQVINYIRGADVFDRDGDGDTIENRNLITGDALHSEPLVVQHDENTRVVYYGSNDGMLHAVCALDGTEMWAFIPPDQLSRLKYILEGTGHQYFIDSSPKIFDSDGDGIVESGEQVILICGERRGGSSYFALDVTDFQEPRFLWRIAHQNDSSLGHVPLAAAPDSIIPELGESWSEPRFGFVKISDSAEDTGTAVMFIGGGYSVDNSRGKAVLAIDVLTGSVVKKFNNATHMDYSFASSVAVVDSDSDGFVEKVYVGDLGGQLWRFGNFSDSGGNPLVFPGCDDNINNWQGQILFSSDSAHTRKFFYPPSITLEKTYDLIFIGTGDRQDACNVNSSDRIYAVKDNHTSVTLEEQDLVDVTDPTAAVPDLNSETGDVDSNVRVDQGWYLRLAAGEKILEKGTVFYRVYYVTTFIPNSDPCVPGGTAKLYVLQYLTAGAGDDVGRSIDIGGGIPSRPVPVITDAGTKLLISVGNTNPDDDSHSMGAGILSRQPLFPVRNCFFRWWMEL